MRFQKSKEARSQLVSNITNNESLTFLAFRENWKNLEYAVYYKDIQWNFIIIFWVLAKNLVISKYSRVCKLV